MDHPSLNNPAEFPDDKVLALYLGPAKSAWDAFMALLQANASPLSVEWRYYNDGMSWLCKVTQKAKTICWVAVWDKFFTAAFYLNAKAEDIVRASSLDKAFKDDFLNPNEKKKFRTIRAKVHKKSDLNAVKELIEIKLKLK